MRFERNFNNCPYSELDDVAYWKKSVAQIDLPDLNPMNRPRFNLMPEDIIASAGSCFAQHISRYVKENGYQFLTTEPPHSFIPTDLASEYNYGTYPARFGNIYTSRQLLQLFKRAYGKFKPTIKPYRVEEYYIDPFRPFIQPTGFISLEEMESDQIKHLLAVKAMFENLDVFIFTLGLTECWEYVDDGSILPSCPGCGVGEFDSDKYRYKNLTVGEVVQDLKEFISLLNEVNSSAKIIFTVSPVPLVATNSGDHVLTATTYSKSVLRVAVQEIKSMFENVDYFPSYEIITTNASRGRYFHTDLRNVLEEGVSHVMRCFFDSYMGIKLTIENDGTSTSNSENYRSYNEFNRILMDVICEEELLEEAIEGG